MYCEDEKEVKTKGISVGERRRDSVSLSHLNEKEIESIEGMVHNHFWVTVTDGRLEVVRRKEELPSPVEDEDMLPFWRRAMPGNKQMQLFDVKIDIHSIPSIIIQSLCGYNYSPENYARQVQKLESYGFFCLRSRRADDSRFWEMWFLPSLWYAQGALKDALESKKTDKMKVDEAVGFLCHNVQFGTLDIAFQRAAMTMDD